MSMILRILAPIALACTLHAARTHAAEPAPPLGRLFMTPELRVMLERQRQLNIHETRSLDGGTMRLDGVVVGSSGKSTVWVNSQPQTDDSNDAGTTFNRGARETTGSLADGEVQVHRPAPRK